MGINSGHYTLSGSLLISGSSINLTGKIEVFYYFGFKSGPQICRIEEIIFDGISRLINNSVLKTLNSMKRIKLDLERERRRETLEIIFIGVSTFRLEKEKVRIFIRKGPDLIFNARTVTRSLSMNHSSKHRGL